MLFFFFFPPSIQSTLYCTKPEYSTKWEGKTCKYLPTYCKELLLREVLSRCLCNSRTRWGCWGGCWQAEGVSPYTESRRCAEKAQKNSCQGTVPARLQTGFMQNWDSMLPQVPQSLIIAVGETTRLVTRLFSAFDHLTNLSKKQMCFGLVSKPGYSEDSFFPLCNLYIICPYAYQKGKFMQRMAWKRRPETRLLRLCPSANGGPATQHHCVPELLQK